MPTTRRRRRQEVRRPLSVAMRHFFEWGDYGAAIAAACAAGEADERGGFRGLIELLTKCPGHEVLWH